MRFRFRCRQFAAALGRDAGVDIYFSWSRSQSTRHPETSRVVKRRAKDRFCCTNLPGYSARDDGAQPFILRQRLLHELGEQPRRHGHPERAFCEDDSAFDGFL